MTSQTFFLVFIPILAFLLLALNIIFAPHNPYQEKNSAFECGFHSFLGQNRSEFNISFFIFALLFLLFDLEILLVYPYVVSGYVNGVFGLIIMLIFFLVLTLGFAFELGKNALSIESKQTSIKNTNLAVSPPNHYNLAHSSYLKTDSRFAPITLSYTKKTFFHSSRKINKSQSKADPLTFFKIFLFNNTAFWNIFFEIKYLLLFIKTLAIDPSNLYKPLTTNSSRTSAVRR